MSPASSFALIFAAQFFAFGVLTATYGAWQMRTGARNMRAIYVMVG